MQTVTFTRPDETVKVYHFTTTPTDSSEPLFRVEVLSAKAAAVEQIKAQPFYAPNALELTGSPLAASPATGGSDVE